MLHRLIFKVTKFQLPTPNRFRTVVKNILGAYHAPTISDRVNWENLATKAVFFLALTE